MSRRIAAQTRLPRRPTAAMVRPASRSGEAHSVVVTLLTTIGVAGMTASLLYALVTLGLLSVRVGVFA